MQLQHNSMGILSMCVLTECRLVLRSNYWLKLLMSFWQLTKCIERMIQLLAQFNIRVLPLKTVLLTPHTPNLNPHFSQNSQKCGLATVLPDSVSNSILYYLLSETVARNSVPSSSPSQPPFDTSCSKIELCDNSVHRTTDPKGSASMGHDMFSCSQWGFVDTALIFVVRTSRRAFLLISIHSAN